MRLATVRTPTGTRAVLVDGEVAREFDARDVGALLATSEGAAMLPLTGVELAVDSLDYAPLVPAPRKIFCLGLNYRAHILEMGHEFPDHPTVFAKFPVSLVGARDDVLMPAESKAVDWEAELGVVIGRTVRRASADAARDAIAGYTVVNDVSMRDWQYRTQQWLQGKTWERSTPVGPWLVTPDEVDHAVDLRVTCAVDDEVMQDGRTSDLLFDPVERSEEHTSELLSLRHLVCRLLLEKK